MNSLNNPLYIFGTGNAQATHCYNTCSAFRRGEEFFMIDAGGGNGILRILDEMNVPIPQIHHLFVTHEHTDHILGVVWMVRMVATAMKKGAYSGNFMIYCHKELESTIRTLCTLTIQKKFTNFFDDRILFVPLSDGDRHQILDLDITFFDIQSTKAKQFACDILFPDGTKVCFAGDEPLQPATLWHADGKDWLFHEAFCLYEDREIFKPYEKHHSTVMDSCKLAAERKVPKLLLWHTEDSDIPNRKSRYLAEGTPFFDGELQIPDDREIIYL